MSNPPDWLHIYSQNLRPTSNQAPLFNGVSASDPLPDATVVTTAAISDASAHLSSDQARVTKPVRRRSRASRRTPTTLLNTDTSNFRAMVQQFTGGPSAPYALSSAAGSSHLNFGFGQARQPVNHDPMMIPSEFQIPAHMNLLHPQNQQQFMFALNSNNQNSHSVGIYSFPPTLDGSQPENLMGLTGGASMDSVSPELGNGGRGNNFFR